MPLIPAFGGQRQTDLCGFQVCLVLQSEFQGYIRPIFLKKETKKSF